MLLFSKSRVRSNDVAVVGFSGRFPAADNANDFWDNLKRGVRSACQVPEGRWSFSDNEAAETLPSKGGFIDDIFSFDPEYFNFSKKRASLLAPQYRLLLELSSQAINHAGYKKEELSNKKVGVYIGMDQGDYGISFGQQDFLRYDPFIYNDKNGVIGNVYPNLAANLISKFFNISGPSLTLNSACSSSLVAIHLACQSLINGECDFSIAGAAQVHLSPFPFLCAANTGVLSADAQTRTFSHRAGGYVLSEGVGCVVLKRLDDAIAQGDHIYGVVKGSAVNNDGKTMSVLLANPEAQKSVINEAIQKAGIDAGEISYVEANGTAMPVGDPLEVNAISEVFRTNTKKKQYCAIGSIEPNVGHMVNASGIGRIIKVLKSLEHKKIPPFIYADEVSPDIDFSESPFYLNNTLIDWPEIKGKRIAGISAFGFGGTNAHIVVEEFKPEKYNKYRKRKEPLAPIDFNKVHLDYRDNRNAVKDQNISVPNSRASLISTYISPLLHANVSDFYGQKFESQFTGNEIFLANHKVVMPDGSLYAVMPGVAYLELARVAAALSHGSQNGISKGLSFKNISWQQALKVDNNQRIVDTSLAVSDSFETVEREGNIYFEIGSRPVPSEGKVTLPRVVHASGEIAFSGGNPEPIVALEKIQTCLADNQYAGEKCYQAFDALGIHYGEGHKGIQDIKVSVTDQGDRQALARVVLPESVKNTRDQYVLHPSILDSSLQVCISLLVDIDALSSGNQSLDSAPALPFELGELQVYDDLPDSLYVWVRKSDTPQKSPEINQFDIDLIDTEGVVILRFIRFTTKSTLGGRLISEKESNASTEHEKMTEISSGSKGDHQDKREDLYGLTLSFLARMFSTVLKIDEALIEENTQLDNYNIDSIAIVEINKKLEEIFGRLSKTLLFEYQTLSQLTEYFVSNHTQKLIKIVGREDSVDEIARSTTNVVSESTSEKNTLSDVTSRVDLTRFRSFAKPHVHQPQQTDGVEPMAIIGLSGRYPQAENLDVFWENLIEGKECVREIPQERWPLEGFYHPDPKQAADRGMSYSKWGAMLEGFSEFDPLFFNISPREAINIDPQERIFLQACWEALEDSGYTRSDLEKKYNKRVGVFAGITKTGFDLYGPELWSRKSELFPRSSFPSVANRVSYIFNIQGPSYPIDTMCSSSLTAIHEAAKHIQMGECELAIVGGVNLYLHPANYVALSSGFMLSQDGHCRSFGKGGNGFVPGEGVGVIVLKKLKQAMADRDNIHAVVRGSSVNHGGKTNGYTVPNPNAQADLIKTAIGRAGISAEDVSYIEAHGTGTELGDPIEFTGLTQAFKSFTDKKTFCALGSIKANIGHLEAAAGMAGLTKVILQMKNKKLVPTINAAEHNQNLDIDGSPFVLNRELRDWNNEGRPRIAGISSFGSGGANAHVLIEEYNDTEIRTEVKNRREYAVVLSAKTKNGLGHQLRRLLDYIRRLSSNDQVHSENEALENISYTLQVGREAMQERFACIVESLDELEEKLKQAENGVNGIARTYSDSVKQQDSSIGVFNSDRDAASLLANWLTAHQYAKLLPLWVKGVNVDWHALYTVMPDKEKPKRVSLPTYPFERTRYWFSDDIHPHARKVNDERQAEAEAEAKAENNSAASKNDRHLPQQPVELPDSVNHSDFLDGLLVDVLAKHLKIENRELIEFDRELDEYGMDSIVSVHILDQLNETFPDITRSLFLEHRTLGDVKTYLINHYGKDIDSLRRVNHEEEKVISGNMQTGDTKQSEDSDNRFFDKGKDRDKISSAYVGDIVYRNEEISNHRSSPKYPSAAENYAAIIGLAGFYPGASDGEEFWEKLENSEDFTTVVSLRRLALMGLEKQENDVASKNVRALIDDVEYFDHKRFKIPLEEAQELDPQQRKLMEASWCAITDAGYSLKTFRKKKTGVFVAVNGESGYADILLKEENQAKPRMLLSTYANRISNSLNLMGPSETIETGCSSFLVAIKHAITALKLGRCEQAIVACAELSLSPEDYLTQRDFQGSSIGLYSSLSRTKSFSSDSDGYLKSESVGAIVLKLKEHAKYDLDPIYAYIRGVGVCHGGKAPIKWFSPNVSGQKLAIEEALDEAQVDPTSISYIEPEANGSQLGDASEILAIQSVYGKYLEKSNPKPKKPFYISSLKPQTGHAEAASTFPVMVKMLMALRYKRMLKVKGLGEVNRGITLKENFQILKQNKPWIIPTEDQDIPRRGAVHSMSFGGVNAHMILEEYRAEEVIQDRVSYLFVFSDASKKQLRSMMLRYLSYLKKNPSVKLARLEYTLKSGREMMASRLAIVASSQSELVRLIREWLECGAGIDGKVCCSSDDDTVENKKQRESDGTISDVLYEQAMIWSQGTKIDWEKTELHRVQRLHLPHNELEKVYCWYKDIQGDILDKRSESGIGALTFAPYWEEKEIANINDANRNPNRKVILVDWDGALEQGELGKIDDLSRMTSSKATIEARFLDYAKQLFKEIKSFLSDKNRKHEIFQIVVPDCLEKGYLRGISGLLKTAAKENRKFSGQLLILDEELSLSEVMNIANKNLGKVEDCTIKYQGDTRLVQCWLEKDLVENTGCVEKDAIYKEKGVYLVTGGLGGLGYIFSEEIARQVDQPSIILTGRSGLTSEKEAKIKGLRDLGAKVDYYQSNISNYDEVENLVEEIIKTHGKLDGIIHSAGSIRDSYIIRKNLDDFVDVLLPKVFGVYNLDVATRRVRLDFIILFSSVSAVSGNLGQSDYSTGNAFMDSYMEYRNALADKGERFGKTITINWPLWEDGGMDIDDNIKEFIKSKFHMLPLPSQDGVALLNYSLQQGVDHCLVKYGYIEKMRESVSY